MPGVKVTHRSRVGGGVPTRKVPCRLPCQAIFTLAVRMSSSLRVLFFLIVYGDENFFPEWTFARILWIVC